jgi:6-phosphogluconolactonase
MRAVESIASARIVFMRFCLWMATALLLILAGCDDFFTKENGSGTGSGTRTLYVTSAPTGGAQGKIVSFTVGSGGVLTSTGVSAVLDPTPTAVAITPNNNFLYVGTHSGNVDSFSISGNNLTGLSPASVGSGIVAVKVNPAGTVAYALNLNLASPLLSPFLIQSGGTLQATNGQALPATSSNVAYDFTITPAGNFIYVANGTDTVIYSVGSTSSGNPTFAQVTCPNNVCTIASQAVAVNPSGNLLYVSDGRTQIQAYSLASNAVPTAVGNPITGLGSPISMAFDSTGNFLLVATNGDNGLTSFGILQSGVLSKVNSVTTGLAPVQVRVDPNTNTAFTANSGGSPDVSGFSVSSSGRLAAASGATANIGGNASALAVTN